MDHMHSPNSGQRHDKFHKTSTSSKFHYIFHHIVNTRILARHWNRAIKHFKRNSPKTEHQTLCQNFIWHWDEKAKEP